MKPGTALSAAFVAGTLLAIFDALWVLVVERAQAPGYFAWCAALLVGGAMFVGLILGLLRAPAPLLAAALGAAGAGLVWPGWLPPLVVGLGVLICGAWVTPREAPPWRLAVSTVAALAGVVVVAPRLLVRIFDWEALHDTTESTLLALGAVVIVFAIEFLARRLQDDPRVPGAGARLHVATAVALLLAPLLAFATADDDVSPPAPPAPTSPGVPSRPHVLLIVLDTVRADHLSIYGYERPTTRELEARFERLGRGVAFPSVHSDGNWTVPSHASLFTGLAPGEHGAHFTPGNSFFFDIADHATLAERLRDVGYRTIGVWANPWLGRVDGMARGFDVYLRPEMPNRLPQFGEAARRLLTPGVHPEVVETERGDLVLARLESELTACGDVPCFAFANLLDAHAYYVPDLCRGRFIDWRIRETIRLPSLHDDPEQLARFEVYYDEELCDLDARLAGFLDRLDAGGLLDSSWVFITSDHGEAFAEHGNIEHGSSAYAEQVRIPLLVLPPRGQSIAVDPRPANLVDVTRTIAAIADASPPGRGRDLRVEPGDGTDVQASIEFYGDPTKVADRNPRAADPARAVVVDGWKLVEQSGRIELFDLRSDPRERDDLADREPDRVERLRARLPELATSAGPSRDGTISREVLEQLRQLGYGH